MALTVAQLDTAIAVVLKHQKYTLLDREWTFADLGELRALRKDIIAETATTNTSQFRVARFNKPS